MFSPELKKGSMELLILALLEHRERHGYEIGKQIESASGGRLVFQISSLYPTLTRMAKRGWIEGRWVERAGERRRRFYRLTRRGHEALATQRRQWDAYVAAVGDVLEGA